MKSGSDLKLTHSSVLSRNGKPFISVAFERDGDYAEGGIPDCSITRSEGFTDEEIGELESYIYAHKQEIIDRAKGISGFMNMFGE